MRRASERRASASRPEGRGALRQLLASRRHRDARLARPGGAVDDRDCNVERVAGEDGPVRLHGGHDEARRLSGVGRPRPAGCSREGDGEEDPSPHRAQASGHSLRTRYLKMFTARAATSSTTSAESVDSNSINSFAQRLSGNVSVGLKAIEFVNETYM